MLNTLPPELRQLVLGTFILTSLDVNLCDAVLDITTSEAFLQEIVRRIIFITPANGPDTPLAGFLE